MTNRSGSGRPKNMRIRIPNTALHCMYVQVLLSIQSLLTDPFCDVCMEPDIGELYLTDKTAFETVAR
jgi:hypothetical protein